MSKKKPAEGEAFFNPFQDLRQELGKKAPAVPAPKAPAPKAPVKKAPPAPSVSKAALPEDDEALFLQAVSASSFVPMKDARPVEDWSGLQNSLGSGFGQAASAENNLQGPKAGDPSQPDKLAQSARPNRAARSVQSASPAKAPKAPPEPEPLSEAETGLFASAMRGVRPVDGKGRDLPLTAKPEPKINMLEDPDYLQDFLQGKVEFALEYTEEFFEGHVMGLDPLVLAKLRSGQYSPESHIDLHGQNAEQALESLITFLRHAYNKGQRSLVVVTGRGKNSPGGLSVLRQNMQDWLTRDPLKRVVLAFCTAQPKDGGAGAIYVLLRKYKKRGKIKWDRGV